MTDEDLLDGSSYEYKLTKEWMSSTMVPAASVTPGSDRISSGCLRLDTASPFMQSPRVPNFLHSPALAVSTSLREKQYGINGNNGKASLSSNYFLGGDGGSHDLKLNDLGSSISEYKREMEQHEGRRREDLLSSQVALLEVYRNQIASSKVTLEEMKQEYEQKLLLQREELCHQHQTELNALRDEEKSREFTNQVRIGTIKDKLKEKYERKIISFQKDIEDTRTSLYNKKLQVQGSVEFANREITALRLQQESSLRLHKDEIAQKDVQIAELSALVSRYKSSKFVDEELLRNGVEVAALVIHMHKRSKPLASHNMDTELRNQQSTVTNTTKEEGSLQTIVPTAYLNKALQCCKVRIHGDV